MRGGGDYPDDLLPLPRGVYNELRTKGNVQIGSINPAGASPPRLHVVREEDDAGAAFRVDDETNDVTPFLITDKGNVGIGTIVPRNTLHVAGGVWTSSRPSWPRAQQASDSEICFDRPLVVDILEVRNDL